MVFFVHGSSQAIVLVRRKIMITAMMHALSFSSSYIYIYIHTYSILHEHPTKVVVDQSRTQLSGTKRDPQYQYCTPITYL